MRILGIDPGLRRTGWGVIEISGSRLSHVASGTCRSQGEALSERLLSLHVQLTEVLERHAPDAAAVEETFVNGNGAGTLKLGQARAMALLAPAQRGLVVGEYAPTVVKKAVVGVGHAAKAQVAHMVKLLLPGAAPEGFDEVDALAVAICHAHHAGSGMPRGAGAAPRRRTRRGRAAQGAAA